MTHINEDKRKTEGQLVMFDIFNDIDNCPVSAVLLHMQHLFVLVVRTLNIPRNSQNTHTHTRKQESHKQLNYLTLLPSACASAIHLSFAEEKEFSID